MALKTVITAKQALRVQSLVTYIYADPGIGKTSLAFTAGKSILFDFDSGAHRAGKLRRGTTVPVEHWLDVANIEASDVAEYDTIILDTAGRMLDLIKSYLVENKSNRQSDGALKLKAQGYANDLFKSWVGRIRGYGKDVVILAHATEDKKGDDIIFRPDIGGKNKNELYRQADLMGYLTNVDGDKGKSMRMLNFVPCTAYHAKNSGGIGNVALPDLEQASSFLGDLIAQGKEHINSLTDEQVKDLAAQDDLQNWINDCELCERAQDINELIGRADKEHPYYGQMRAALGAQINKLDIELNKAEGRYFDKDASRDLPTNPVTDPAATEASTVVDKPAQTKAQPAVKNEAAQPTSDESAVEEAPLLAELLQRAANAKTEIEATALIRYTHKMDLSDVASVRAAVGKRLLQLKKESKPEQPSLMVRMQQCNDSDELGIIATEIELCEEAIQPKLWEIYEQRHAELSA